MPNQRVFVPSLGPSDWRRLLADPDRHWRRTKSAFELAVAWEAARDTDRGLPIDVATILDGTADLTGSRLLLAFPEHKVALDGGSRASQTDLWGLLKAGADLASLAVEGKAGESFDRLVSDWLRDASQQSGKPTRLRQLIEILGMSEQQAHRCRYQLLHRTAAAILEAQRFGAQHAVMLIQSFRKDPSAHADFNLFAEQFGVQPQAGILADCGWRSDVHLWIGWIDCQPASDDSIATSL